MTTITVLTRASRDYITSFNYDRKKIRDGDLTCRYYLSSIMSDSIFHENMWQLISCFVVVVVVFFVLLCLFCCYCCFVFDFWDGTFVFLGMKEVESVLSS